MFSRIKLEGILNQKVKCSMCLNTKCFKVRIPFVLRYLANELAAMNIRMTFTLK